MLALVAIVLTVWLAVSLIADFRYRSLVSRTIDNVETSLRGDTAFADSAITRDDGCGRGVFKLGAGAKTCRAAIKVEATVSVDKAYALVKSAAEIVDSGTQTYNVYTRDSRLDSLSSSSGFISSPRAFDLQNRDDQPVSQCNLIGDYRTTAERNSRLYLDDTTLGNLEIRLSCSNTDWWTRNVLNKFFY